MKHGQTSLVQAQGLPAKRRNAGLLTQKQVAERYGISKERVYQIENRALKKMRDEIQHQAAAVGVTVRTWLFGDE